MFLIALISDSIIYVTRIRHLLERSRSGTVPSLPVRGCGVADHELEETFKPGDLSFFRQGIQVAPQVFQQGGFIVIHLYTNWNGCVMSHVSRSCYCGRRGSY